MSKHTVRTMTFAVALIVLLAGLASAATKPVKAPKAKVPPRGSKLVYTNFVGAFPFWDITAGYFGDGSSYFNQVLAYGFTPSSNVTFADTALAMGLYAGGGSGAARFNVYLAADAGGQPGAILDGPLTQQYWVQSFNNGRGGGIVQLNCVACPTLTAGTPYWIIANQPLSSAELTWDFADTDVSAPFAFDQVGSITGPWSVVPSGYIRSGFQVDGN